jgi:hypothetical protein
MTQGPNEKGDDKFGPFLVVYSAEEMGWMRRLDLGFDVWETPDGKLYKAKPGEGVPTLFKFAGLVELTRKR